MRARIITANDRSAWDDFVLSHPDTISWHVYDWHEVLKRYYGLEFLPIAVDDGGPIRGILPLYLVRTLRGGTSLVSIPYVVAGGIVADDDSAAQCLLEKAIELSKHHGHAPITLKQYGNRIAGDFGVDQGYYNREVDLSAGLDAVWDALDDNNKSHIESGDEPNLLLDYPSQDIRAFHRVLHRFQHSCGVPCHSRRWLRLLLDTKMYRIACLTRDSQIVAATLVKRFKDTVSFPFTCFTGSQERGVGYAFRLYWMLLQRLSSESVRIFHSGRIPSDGGVPQYRLGWGGEAKRYYYQYYGRRRQTETKSKRGLVRRLGASLWKGLPNRVTGLFDAAIIRQFP